MNDDIVYGLIALMLVIVLLVFCHTFMDDIIYTFGSNLKWLFIDFIMCIIAAGSDGDDRLINPVVYFWRNRAKFLLLLLIEVFCFLLISVMVGVFPNSIDRSESNL